MYNPRMFVESDPTVLWEFMTKHPFAMLLTANEHGDIAVTHLPLVTSRDHGGTFWLTGHIAKGNPHWRLLDGSREATVVFRGPHAYVSPRWYAEPDVPTWDYAVVHAYGVPVILTDPDRLKQCLRELIAPYEADAGGLAASQVVEDFQDKLKRIVGIEMRVDRLVGKFKLDQDRALADQYSVAAALKASARSSDRECGQLILNRLPPVVG